MSPVVLQQSKIWFGNIQSTGKFSNMIVNTSIFIIMNGVLAMLRIMFIMESCLPKSPLPLSLLSQQDVIVSTVFTSDSISQFVECIVLTDLLQQLMWSVILPMLPICFSKWLQSSVIHLLWRSSTEQWSCSQDSPCTKVQQNSILWSPCKTSSP